MSVNASQLELNQLIYRHLKEHGFLSAAEELQRHSPQGESKLSVSLVDIYKSWLNDSKKKRCPKSEKCSKSGEQKTPSKAKTASPTKKTHKPAKIPASPKKSVSAKRKISDEKPSQSVKAKKSKPNTTEKAASDGSDSDSSLDIEKWRKFLDHWTEADVAKMETINALASESQPKKKRNRKPPAKPLSKAHTPVQQNGETVGQNEQGKEKVGTQTPTKKNTAKRSKKESPAHVSSPSKQSPNKRVKSAEASSGPPEKFEKETQLQEVLVPVNAKEEIASETKIKKKKKKAKEENEDKTEGSANETNSDGKDRKQKRNEIIEQEDAGNTEGAKRTTKGKMEERGSDNEDISELSLQKKKAKKKEKDKSSSEEMMVVSEENLKQPDKKIKPGTPKPKKTKENNTEGNLDYISVREEESSEQNIEEMENSKEMVTKEKTSSEEYSAEMHKKKEKKKKKVLYNEGNSELVEDDLKAYPEQIVTSTDEAGGSKTCEQNDQGKKTKKKKDKSILEENLEHEAMAVEGNVEDKCNSEQMGREKKSKKKKRGSLGCKEFPEEVAQEKKAKKKNEKTDENDLVEEEKPKGDDHTNNKSTLETDEGSLEITSTLKKKKKKKKLKSDEAPEEAEISTQNPSITQSNSADVHKKKKKSKRTES